MIGKQKGVVLAGIFGNALEWYDFTVYAFFVPVLSSLYFPTKDPFTSLIATFSVFALGFIVRPFGGVLFGYIGDHIGRKKALILSMIMMSIPTIFLGLLPNYQTIGIAAPLLLTLLRIAQGLAVSGELTTATVFLTEHADANRRGLAGSLAMGSALIGILISSALTTLVTELVSNTQLYSWGFRIPFLIGGMLGLIGLMIRLRSFDPEIFKESQNKVNVKPSVISHLKTINYRTVSIGVLLTSIMAVGNYFLIGYFNTFLSKTQGLPLREVMLINFLALVVQLIMTISMGIFSDYFGRKRVLIMGIFGFIIFSHPIFWLLTQHNIYLALAGEILFALVLGPISGVIPATLSELFDTYNRNTGLSLSYNLSLALFGGTAPLVAISLVAVTHNNYAPAWYITIAAMIALIATGFLRESYKNSLT